MRLHGHLVIIIVLILLINEHQISCFQSNTCRSTFSTHTHIYVCVVHQIRIQHTDRLNENTCTNVPIYYFVGGPSIRNFIRSLTRTPSEHTLFVNISIDALSIGCLCVCVSVGVCVYVCAFTRRVPLSKPNSRKRTHVWKQISIFLRQIHLTSIHDEANHRKPNVKWQTEPVGQTLLNSPLPTMKRLVLMDFDLFWFSDSRWLAISLTFVRYINRISRHAAGQIQRVELALASHVK